MGANSTYEKEVYVTSFWDTMDYIAITTDPSMDPDAEDDGRLYKNNPRFDDMYNKLNTYKVGLGSGLIITFEYKKTGVISHEYVIKEIENIPTYQIENTTIKRVIPHVPNYKSEFVLMMERAQLQAQTMAKVIESNSKRVPQPRISVDKAIENSSFLNVEIGNDEPFLNGKRLIVNDTKDKFNFYNNGKYYKPLKDKCDDTKYDVLFKGVGINLLVVGIKLHHEKKDESEKKDETKNEL